MNETVMPLAEHMQIVVSDRHTFGTDAVVLADFARIRRRDRALDLGTGCGIIPLLWLRDARQSPVACLDIQDRAVRQVQQSIALDHLEERLTVQQADLRDHRQLYPAGSFTLVSMNPPYKPVDTGILSPEPWDQIARHEVCCTLEDACTAAGYLLQFGGRFCICHRPERLADIVTAMRAHDLEPKRLRLVQHREGEAPFLLLMEGRKGANPYLTAEPTLILESPAGRAEMGRIYGAYFEGGAK